MPHLKEWFFATIKKIVWVRNAYHLQTGPFQHVLVISNSFSFNMNKYQKECLHSFAVLIPCAHRKL